MSSTTKGQIAVGELLIALAIFFIAIGVLYGYLRTHTNNITDRSKAATLQQEADAIATLLIRSPGIPSSWEHDVSAVQTPGLSDGDNMLDSDKVASLILVPYDTVRDLFNIAPHDVYVKITQSNGSSFDVVGSDETSTQVAVSHRIVTYNNASAVLNVKVY